MSLELAEHEVEALATIDAWMVDRFKVEDESYNLGVVYRPKHPWLMVTAYRAEPYVVGVAPPVIQLALFRATGAVYEMDGPAVKDDPIIPGTA